VIIALSGQIGTGKTTVAKYLDKNHGFTILSTRKLLADILEAKNMDVNRKSLQDLGSALIFVVGGAGFVAMMLEYLPEGNYVLDAIRYSEAISYLESKYKSRFCHMHLTLEDKIRIDRLRERDGARGLIENYLESDKAETELGGPELDKIADFRFDNGGTLHALHSEVDRIVRSVKELQQHQPLR
jgi:dephospho-CoA kinase